MTAVYTGGINCLQQKKGLVVVHEGWVATMAYHAEYKVSPVLNTVAHTCLVPAATTNACHTQRFTG